MIRRPPRSTLDRSSAASDVYKRQEFPYLFQKFYRVSRVDSDIPGAGMGLVFVKQIVDLHKGLINIQSEPNKGTSVLIKLSKNHRD